MPQTRENHARYMREVWYPKNREKHQLLVAKRRKEIRGEVAVWINDMKSSLGCVECGNKDFRVLDFDHKDPTEKILGIAQLVRKTIPLERLKEELLAEIAKCEIRCANCHRIRTWLQRH